MIKNYLASFFVKLKKNYFFNLLNYLSLAIGLASAIIIIQYLYKEFNYDKFHKNYDRIYRVAYERTDDKQFTRRNARINNPFGFALHNDFEEIENFSRIFKYYVDAKYEDKKYREENTYFVDSTFLQMFNFPLIDGSKDRLLNSPNTVILTKSTSKKYFGDESPVGKIINIYFEQVIPMEVVGVVDDLKANTHFQFDLLISLSSIERL